MCGISGIAYRDVNHPVSRSLLKQMSDIMVHRGPDGEGFYYGPGVGFAMRRLSIIDLESGDQPITNEDQSIFVICNGEIYNYLELREKLVRRGHQFQTKSDVEVIAHLYEDYGIDSVTQLRGMFAIALWDTKKKKLFLVRDRLGIKPLHYALTKNQNLIFGSEYKSILVTDLIDRKVNSSAFWDLFTFGRIHTPKTFFQHINKLSPGHYLVYDQGSVDIKSYWNLSFQVNQNLQSKLSEEEWGEALKDKLIESIKIHLRADVTIAGWLSAGIDSSAVAAISQKLLSKPFQTYSLAFEDKTYDEVRFQKTLDEYSEYEILNRKILIKKEHFNLYPQGVWYQEDPSTDLSSVFLRILAKETSKDFKVVMVGEGSDEMFGGYSWYRFHKLCYPFSFLPLFIRKLMLFGPIMPQWQPRPSSAFLAPRKMDLIRYSHLTSLLHRNHDYSFISNDYKQAFSNAGKSALELTNFTNYEKWKPFEQMQYMEVKTRMVDHIIHRLDRHSMSHSVEARVPFLDHEFVELCCKIPPSLKMKYLKEKYILRKAMMNYLPKVIVKRKKYGLQAPGAEWLQNDLPEFVTEMLSKERIKEKGYFDFKVIDEMLKAHRGGRKKYTQELIGCLSVQICDEYFVKGRYPGNSL